MVGHRGYRASYGANNHYLHLEDSPFSRIYFTLLKRPRMTIHEDDLDMSNSFLSSLKTVEMSITLNPKNSDIGQQIDKRNSFLCLQRFFVKMRIVNGAQFGRLSQLSHGP